jgi:hypothetical protein
MRRNATSELFKKLNNFITKYYQNQLIKGSIYVVSILLIFFILFSLIEHFSALSVGGRTFLFWAYILINLAIFVKYIAIPLLHLLKIGNRINNKDAAKIIGNHFKDVDDKLLNILELEDISESDNALISASIEQKIKTLKPIRFSNAIDFYSNKKQLKWLLIPLAIFILFFISGKDYILTESSARIVKHNTFFEPEAPFNYQILNDNLNCIQFEDYNLKLKVVGNEIPNEVFVKIRDNTYTAKATGNNEFEHLFKSINSDVEFNLIAGGYNSQIFTITSLSQPKVVDMGITIHPPKYTNATIKKVENNGDIIIAEGSNIKWRIQLQNTTNCSIVFDNKVEKKSTTNSLNFQKKIYSNTTYSIISSNENNLTDSLTYYIKVIPDEFPQILLEQEYDSSNQQYIFNGTIEDDYKLRRLEFIYSYTLNDSLITTTAELNIQGLNVEHFKVWDNDGVNGSKFTKTKTFIYKEPSTEDLIKKKDIENDKTKSGINKSISLAEEIKKDIDELNKAILEKKKIGWEEKEKTKNILKKQKELEKQIKNTQKKNSENLKNKEKLNSSILEKQKKLEELMNKVFDEEMKKLLKEMEEMMDKADKEKLKDLLEKLDKENTDLEKELDRELELFKQLEFEQKVEETLDKLEKLKEEQKKLKEETEKGEKGKEELSQKQEELNKEMAEVKKDLQDLRKKNMELEDKNEIPNTQKSEEDIQKNMEESKESLDKGKKKKASKSQQSAIDEMEDLENKLQNMKQSSGESKPKEDMETLRKILENLVTLSFDQEYLMEHVNNTPRNSPEFVKIVQEQNKLSDNSKIIEDSLFALSKRVIQIQATINKEIASINRNMQKATKELERREVNKATERQQFVMTATNNLALLLSEILEQMQKDLERPPSQCNKPKNCNKPNPNCKKPSMSELKKAQKKLNKKMKKGKNGKKGKGKKKGEKQSKELMELAKQQEQIRNQLMELREEIGDSGDKGKIDKILEGMEETERDIINNRITQETINRQAEILSRLLEAENADREQEEDNKRKAKEWEFEPDNTTKEYLEYKKQKKAQEELLKTTPVQLTPFYKKKVNNYFNTIIND